MSRLATSWTVRRGRVVDPETFCLVGIVNVTPDSFFDGGQYFRPEAAVEHGLKLLGEGAALLDIGAESTRPGAKLLGNTLESASAVETARVLPVVQALRSARPGAFLCVDTCHARTARRVLEAGVDVINDVSALERDPALLEVLVDFLPGYVLMHGGDHGGSTDCGDEDTITERVLAFFSEKLEQLVRAGLPEDHVVLDPGIGFGKTQVENVRLLHDIRRLGVLGRPLYVGLSMKSLFGALLGLPLEQRGEATRLAVALLATQGVAFHRVHDVHPAMKALQIAKWFV